MNILFVYSIQKSLLIDKPLKGQEDIQIGIAQLSAVLKKNGHSTDILILDRKYKGKTFALLKEKLLSTNFGIVCFSSVYSEIDFILKLADYVKREFDIFTILGGVHATISPDEEYLKYFNALCIGEGELALTELVYKLENNQDIATISNLWIKQDDRVIKNKTSSFIQDLDSLPFVDRDLWQSHIFEKNSRLTVLVGRGCPYNCTYCCNHRIKQVADGKYVRLRSPENIIEEIRSLTIQFPYITEYFLEIETFGADTKWLADLCERLSFFNLERKQKLSFSANLRVYDSIDLEFVFSNLCKANFESVTIGLESGNERIRKEILNRNYSNETITKAVSKAREYNIKVGIFNLMGLPTESFEDFQDTLKLNQRLQPDWHATSIFFPYKGTRLHEIAEELGLLKGEINFKNERQHAVLDLPGFSKKQIQKQFDSFHYNVYKKSSNKSFLKLCLYSAQVVLGHNFLANMKNRLFVIFNKLGIKNNLLRITQKS